MEKEEAEDNWVGGPNSRKPSNGFEGMQQPGIHLEVDPTRWLLAKALKTFERFVGCWWLCMKEEGALLVVR